MRKRKLLHDEEAALLPYSAPSCEVTPFKTESLMAVISNWNGSDGTMPIEEGDPDDGPGAKDFFDDLDEIDDNAWNAYRYNIWELN